MVTGSQEVDLLNVLIEDNFGNAYAAESNFPMDTFRWITNGDFVGTRKILAIGIDTASNSSVLDTSLSITVLPADSLVAISVYTEYLQVAIDESEHLEIIGKFSSGDEYHIEKLLDLNYIFKTGKATNVKNTILGLVEGSDTLTISYYDIESDIIPIAITGSGTLTFNAQLFELNTSCNESNGSISVVPIGGTPPYSYLWSNGSTDSLISNLDPGYYQVLVSDSSQIQSIFGVEISNKGLPPFEDHWQNTDTTLMEGDSIVLNVSLYPGSYIWSTGDTSSMIVVYEPGTYSVSVTNMDGCTSSDSLKVDFSTSYYETSFDDYIKVIPNPSNGVFEIKFQKLLRRIAEIKILNLQGQMVWSKSLSIKNGFESIAIDLSESP